MTFKLKGGRPVTHTKWAQERVDAPWISVASDCNGGSFKKSIVANSKDSFDAVIVHFGLLKFSSELQELTNVSKNFKSLEAAKEWCKKQVHSLAVKHDALVELTPQDFRILSSQTSAGPLVEGPIEDFGASQKQPEKFRTKRRRK